MRRPGLAGKLALTMIAIVACGLLFQAILDIRRVRAVQLREHRNDLEHFGSALGSGAEELWRTSGEEAARRFLERVDARRSEFHIQLHAGSAAWSGPRQDGDAIRMRVPLEVAGQVVGTLEIARTLADQKDFLGRLVQSKAIIAAGLLLVCGGLAVSAGMWLLGRPLARLTEQVEAIGGGNFSPNLEVGRRDEIGTLARTMNTMVERLSNARTKIREERRARTAALEQLRHADRLATVGKIASGIAHQLGTPLNVVSGRAAMIASSEAPKQVRDDAAAISKAAQNMAQIIQQLLHFSRRRGLQTERTRLREVLEEADRLVEPIAERSGVEIAVPESDSVEAVIDPRKLLQVLTNLMMNGIQAMPNGGTLTLGARHEHVAEPPEKRARPGDYVCVFIEDEGVGMSTGELEHIFEPFFTTKIAGEGTGLGLSVSHGIVRQHGGWIQVKSERGRGSRFEVYLPEESEA